MEFKIVEQNMPEDYIITEKYRNMINDENNYSIEEFKKAKEELELIRNNYSDNQEYKNVYIRVNKWVIKFNEIIKKKSLAKIMLRQSFNKLKNN